MEDRDFRVGDKITGFKLYHGIVSDKFQGGIFSVDNIGNTIAKSFHGHLDLEDIQRYIESKEQKPARKVTKYVNIWIGDNGFYECKLRTSKEESIKIAEGSSNKYLCIALPIEVIE